MNSNNYYIIFVLCEDGTIEIPTVCDSLRDAQYFVDDFKQTNYHIQIWISEGIFGCSHNEIPGTRYTF
jgi:hypothetical protein